MWSTTGTGHLVDHNCVTKSGAAGALIAVKSYRNSSQGSIRKETYREQVQVDLILIFLKISIKRDNWITQLVSPKFVQFNYFCFSFIKHFNFKFRLVRI